jgi:hypothetical protein
MAESRHSPLDGVLPWSLAAEITRQMAAVRDWGGRFLVAMPELTVL